MAEQMTKQDKKEYEEWLDTKNTNVDALCLHECVQDAIQQLWEKHCNRFCFHPMKDYVSYGDTYVDTPSYIGDEEDQQCREEFEKYTTVENVMYLLQSDNHFIACINKMIEDTADNQEIET